MVNLLSFYKDLTFNNIRKFRENKVFFVKITKLLQIWSSAKVYSTSQDYSLKIIVFNVYA